MRRICKYCGREYDGDPGGSCCPDCAAAQRVSTLRERVCRTCGRKFPGGPRARYCPDCRAERRKTADREYRQRARAGGVRRIGSEDICRICGRPYTVNSGRQQYCPDCAPEAVREIDRRQSLAWNRANTTPEDRRAERKAAAAAIPCAICGELFIPTTAAMTCSPECSAELRRRRAADFEQRNRDARNADQRRRRADRLAAMTTGELAAYRAEVNRKAREAYARRKKEET